MATVIRWQGGYVSVGGRINLVRDSNSVLFWSTIHSADTAALRC